MCIQSYYNYTQNQTELKLDLLSEIKKFGINKWRKKVNEEMEKIKNDKQLTKQIAITDKLLINKNKIKKFPENSF